MRDDDDLLTLLSKGDEAAFDRLFFLYRKKVYQYLFSFVKLHHIAEELTIDVFLKLWLKKHTLINLQSIDAFLFVVAKRKALDFLKNASRSKRVQQLIEGELLDEKEINFLPDAVSTLENKQLLELILNDLSPQRRSVLMLSRIDGLSHEEIANELNISQNTVKNTISQTLKSLKPLKRTPWIETCWLIGIALSQF